jgi:hypothetical protein
VGDGGVCGGGERGGFCDFMPVLYDAVCDMAMILCDSMCCCVML